MTVATGFLVLALAGQAARPTPPPTPTPAPTPTPSPTPTPAQNPEPDGPVVVLDTSMGVIRLRLYQTKSPVSSENFLRYVREGFYDGTIFHRVIPNFMVQAGGFTPDMKEKQVHPPVRNEARNRLRNLRGAVSLARTNDPNSATAQFFINVKSNHVLDFGITGAGYAVFGAVLDGMDVVDRIVATPTGVRGQFEDVPNTPIVIRSARIESEAAPPPPPGPAS
jgi:cyclophilin family peptidyl-prolyl cis-trans isomerase